LVFVYEDREAVNTLSTAIIAIFTVVLSIATANLWRATNRHASIAERSLIDIERAFVFPADRVSKSHFDPEKKTVWWSIQIVWGNSGKTPTKDLVVWCEHYLEDHPMPRDFAFLPKHGRQIQIVIGPGPTMNSYLITVDGVDLAAVQVKKKHFYIWGYASYRDVFSGTRQHITRFCYKVLLLGDPCQMYSATNIVEFTYAAHPHYNCADDECERQDKEPRGATI
jgi:hypothetical protein